MAEDSLSPVQHVFTHLHLQVRLQTLDLAFCLLFEGVALGRSG
jgi:hypothetical protein